MKTYCFVEGTWSPFLYPESVTGRSQSWVTQVRKLTEPECTPSCRAQRPGRHGTQPAASHANTHVRWGWETPLTNRQCTA